MPTIGQPGVPWGAAERAEWRSRQVKQRSYEADLLGPIEALAGPWEVLSYGELAYDGSRFPLRALRSPDWRADRPTVLVTGGVHGYETSGAHGALRFARDEGRRFPVNLLVAPCVSPWGYEVIHRWNPDAVDPNRSFLPGTTCQEAAALMALVGGLDAPPLLHIDLHETTDTDRTVFRPTLASRDGKVADDGEIPDGFYTVGDTARPEQAFQEAVIAAVARVTHIAEPDAQRNIIGVPLLAPGVILYDARPLGLCMGMTDARFVTTTEVYPDSPRTDPEVCIEAQVAAVVGAIEHALDAASSR